MKVELTRLCIEGGKAHRVDEWLRTANARMDEALKTLERRGFGSRNDFTEAGNLRQNSR